MKIKKLLSGIFALSFDDKIIIFFHSYATVINGDITLFDDKGLVVGSISGKYTGNFNKLIKDFK
jgi:hypothetical protein